MRLLWDWLSHISTVELLLEALVIPLWARFVVELWVIKLRFCIWVPFLFLHMLTAFCMGVPPLHVGKVDFPFPPWVVARRFGVAGGLEVELVMPSVVVC
jgi:hypothetical protein